MVADRIKPALTVEPEFLLRDDSGTERRFGDIDSLSERSTKVSSARTSR